MDAGRWADSTTTEYYTHTINHDNHQESSSSDIPSHLSDIEMDFSGTPDSSSDDMFYESVVNGRLVYRSDGQNTMSSRELMTINTRDEVSVTSLQFPVRPDTDTEYCRQSCPSSNLQFHPVRLKKKSVCMTYILTLFLGIVGAHHFYLGRPKFGTLYVFTAGLFGLGYVVDLVRVPWLVENANLELFHPELRGRKYIVDAYLLWLPPFGLLGFHHFYLGNTCNALVYLISVGALLIGWLMDICFVPLIWMKKANTDYHHIISTINNEHSPEMTEQPEMMSRDCAVVTSPDIFYTSPQGALPAPSTIMLTPPPYSEIDELATGQYSPPSYHEVLAMDARESET